MELQTPSTTTTTATYGGSATNEPPPPPPISDELDNSACSTPYVSAPSSPSHGPPISGFYYSAPASPMHFSSSKNSSSSSSTHNKNNSDLAFEFEFSAKFGSTGSDNKHESSVSTTMSSADELFLDGKIRPMKLSTHLEKPQVLAPLLETQERQHSRARMREKSLRRRTRSLSPLRNMHSEWNDDDDEDNEDEEEHEDVNKDITGNHANKSDESSMSSASSSRSSSAGGSSKRWVFLKDFLRSKSEGRSNNKFWSSISFSPAKERKPNSSASSSSSSSTVPLKFPPRKVASGKPVNGGGKRRVPPSAHELHYTANRAQAEEMRKKTYLPYRQGLFGCLGFSSKGYGAVHGFARALNPVSSR